MKRQKKLFSGYFAVCLVVSALQLCVPMAQGAQWTVFETSFESAKVYSNAFTEVEVDVIFQQGDKQWKVPAFWAGDKKWTVRFAPPVQGKHTYRVECTDKAIPDSTGKTRRFQLKPTKATTHC
jgi:hypothetical protein